MGNVKETNNINQTYSSFDNMMNIKDFDRNLLKIGKRSYQTIDMYYIGYITMKDSQYIKIDNVIVLNY